MLCYLRVSMASATLPFTREQMSAAVCEVLREGRWANARVLKVTIDGAEWTVKDFGPRGWFVRQVIGRWLLRRELRALKRLEGLDGVPAQPFLVDECALAARFIPGSTLDRAPQEQMNEKFFLALEALFNAIHARGLVHLDSRGSSNLLATPQGTPAVIDFQAALRTRWLPRPLRRRLEAVDLGGVYKNWLRRAPASLDAGRRAEYERSTRWRRLWIGRGYFGMPKQHKRKTSE